MSPLHSPAWHELHLSQTSVPLSVPASWHDSPDLSRQVYRWDLDSNARTGLSGPGIPDAPTPSPYPETPFPAAPGSAPGPAAGWTSCSALPAPTARLPPFDKQRQPSTWPRLSIRPRPGPGPALRPAHRSSLLLPGARLALQPS